MMLTKVAVGVDLGGTNLALGLVDQSGKIIAEQSTPITNRGSWAVPRLIGKQVNQLVSANNVEVFGVGCGLPGLVDCETGKVHQSPHFPDWQDLPISELLAAQLDWPTVIDNDANMFARGEMYHGAGKELSDFIILTLGSGIGGAVVSKRQLFKGKSGFAGEFAHMTVASNEIKCTCGNRDCLELYASSVFFSRQAKAYHDAEKAALLARQGDQNALQLWDQFGSSLGVGINSLMNAFGINTFIIAGGISKAIDLFLPQAKSEIAARAYRKHAENVQILPAKLGASAGLIGAATSAWNSTEQNL